MPVCCLCVQCLAIVLRAWQGGLACLQVSKNPDLRMQWVQAKHDEGRSTHQHQCCGLGAFLTTGTGWQYGVCLVLSGHGVSFSCMQFGREFIASERKGQSGWIWRLSRVWKYR